MSAEGSIDLVRQLRAHLESLQAAGVLFIPRGEPLALSLRTGVSRRVDEQNPATPRESQPEQDVPLRDSHSNRAGSPEPSEPPEDSLEVRRRELAVLRTEVAKCDKCSELFSTRTQTVFGSGPLDAEVAFVGEAPGAAEDAQGEPFVGKGGQLLGRIIAACGFTHDHVYLFNIIKCRPPASRAPTMTECANCRDFFRRQFELVKPKFLVALGTTASRLLTGQNLPLAKLRGTVHRYRGVQLVCTNHPDEIENDKSGTRKRETWDDMKLLLRAMGRAVPTPK